MAIDRYTYVIDNNKPVIYDYDETTCEIEVINITEVADILNHYHKEIQGLNNLLQQYILFLQEKGFSFREFLDWMYNKPVEEVYNDR